MKCNGATESDLREYLLRFGNGADVALPGGAGLYVAEIKFGDKTRVWVRSRTPVARAQKSGLLVAWAPLALGLPTVIAKKHAEAPPDAMKAKRSAK